MTANYTVKNLVEKKLLNRALLKLFDIKSEIFVRMYDLNTLKVIWKVNQEFKRVWINFFQCSFKFNHLIYIFGRDPFSLGL